VGNPRRRPVRVWRISVDGFLPSTQCRAGTVIPLAPSAAHSVDGQFTVCANVSEPASSETTMAARRINAYRIGSESDLDDDGDDVQL
jgi:hypothetical protein